MSQPLKDADFLDNWIRTQAFRHAFNEKKKGFIGKKIVTERILNTIPREFTARGLSKESVALRLTEMLANDLTQALIRDCDEKRIKAKEAEVSASRNLIENGVATTDEISISSTPVIAGKSPASNASYVPGSSGVGGANGKPDGVMPGAPGNPFIGVGGSGVTGTSAITSVGTSGIGGAVGVGFLGVGNAGAFAGRSGQLSSSLGGFGLASTTSDNTPEKGKKPVTRMIEVENEDEGIAIPAASDPKHRPMSQSLVVSVSDVDRAIADFVAARLPGKASEVCPKTSSRPAGNSKDIFSRGGSSSPASPTSSIFLPPSIIPPMPLDAEIPSLPFKHQHRILTALQSILESAYYDFARKHYPTFIVRKGWDCPEAGELTQWTRELASEFRQKPTKVVGEAENLPAALKETDEIRHSAVHRIPVSGRDIQRLIESSRVVVHILDDTKRMREINEMSIAIERNIQVVHNQRRKKEEKLRAELEKLDEWKTILELREIRAIKQAEIEEERIQKRFRDEVGRALDLLGTEEGAKSGISTDMESVGHDNRDGEPALYKSGGEQNAENSVPDQQEEEYFHESEVWPVEAGVSG